MKYISEKVSYIKGLAEGLGINDSTNEGKIIKAIIDVLDDIATAVDDIEEVQEQLSDELFNMDQDLSNLEKTVLIDEQDVVICPGCGEAITYSIEDGNVVYCPNCNEEIDIDDEFEDDENEEI